MNGTKNQNQLKMQLGELVEGGTIMCKQTN